MHTRAIAGASLGLALLIGTLTIASRPKLEGIYLADGPIYGSLSELAEHSTLVVRGSVIKTGTSYRVALSPRVVADAPAPSARNGEEVGKPAPFVALDPTEDNGLLKTDSYVRVDEVLVGSGASKGDVLTVSQLGGTDEQNRSIVNQDDPLQSPGDDSIWFLMRDPRDGRYFATGAGQGRFIISKDTVHAVSHYSPVSQQSEGKSLVDFRAAILALR